MSARDAYLSVKFHPRSDPSHCSLATKISPARKKRRSQARPQGTVQPARAPADPIPWWRSTWLIAAVGAVLLYLAFPPANLWLLAWVAPVPWVLLARLEKLPERRPYPLLYLVGAAHWLVLLQWVRLGHWAAYFGWFALTLYLACYLPLFVGLTRVAHIRLRVPMLVAAPAIWVGLEALRGWLFTGLAIALLGHTQIHQLHLVQISDLGGAYLVSFLVMVVATAIAESISASGIQSPEHEMRAPCVSLVAAAAGRLSLVGDAGLRTLASWTRPVRPTRHPPPAWR